MAKLTYLTTLLLVLTFGASAQGEGYWIRYFPADTDSAGFLRQTGAASKRASRLEADAYLAGLPAQLRAQGYLAASIDSLRLDSAEARVWLFLGPRYQWARVRTRPADAALLEALRFPAFEGPLDFSRMQAVQQQILDRLEEEGYPFGKVELDSFELAGDSVSALLRIDRGPAYRIDSIRVYGDAKVSNEFLQRYLGISNGSPYNKRRLDAVSRRLSALNYLQEDRRSDLSLLGTGSVLNLYLKNRRSSQVNALVGFLPNPSADVAQKKLLITADVNILLRNALGSGETMGLVWQQLQQRSPRLNLLFDRPYIFGSPFGLNLAVDMYKRDSLYLNVNMNLGLNYGVGEGRSATVFLQRRSTIVSGINAGQVIASRRLPQDADVSSLNLGVGYSLNNTDYRFNPRKGTELNLTGSAGTKKVRRNNLILELEDPFDPSFKFSSLYDTVKLKAYQVRITGSAAHFIPVGKQSAIRTALNGGWFQSPSYFRNELFQIGGIKLLRGFDEESQFVSRYAIGTLEYRLRLQLNAYFYGFVDGGWGDHKLEGRGHSYLGTGLGLSLEVKAGIINIAWALGKRDDTELNLRQSRVHLGFASYF